MGPAVIKITHGQLAIFWFGWLRPCILSPETYVLKYPVNHVWIVELLLSDKNEHEIKWSHTVSLWAAKSASPKSVPLLIPLPTFFP